LPRRQPPTERKRRTREHVIADLSVNYVERQALLCGFSVERLHHDYGIDLILSTYTERGEAENGYVVFQLKATDHVQWVAKGQALAYRLDRADLQLWLSEPFPLILVVYDATADRAYWLYVQAYFAKQASFNLTRAPKTVSVRIPTTNVLDPAAIRTFQRYRNQVVAQTQGVITYEE
jgi:hypothetical protein